MTKLEQLSQNLKVLQNRTTMYEVALRTAKRFEAYLIDINQIQLSQGLSIFGEVVGVYSENTEEIAKTENTRQPKTAGANYNFEWSGEFFDGMRITLTQDYLEFTSTATDSDEILARYSNLFGDQILLGLTKEGLDQFLQEKLKPELITYTCEVLGLVN